ncbi:MAG: ATP-binding protein [Clostridiales bacterium]|nr:ATP-binding protein [Clostridiales bacterium]
MYIERPLYIKTLDRYKDKDLIKVVTGVRRSGKSVLLFELFYQHLIKTGVPRDNIIRINLENEENRGLRSGSALYSYITAKRKSDIRYYIMIDEIQYIHGFEDLLNSLKNSNCDVYVTGSNARMLSGDISTALRGRSIEIRVFPLSFAEFYSYTGGEKRSKLNQYMKYGGFPYTVTEEDERSKFEYLKMLESTVASKDIIDKYHLRNPAIFNAVYDYLCSNIGSLVSAKKISDTLRSNGFKTVTPDTIGNYLEYLCESFLFYKVCRYDIKGKEYLKTLNKYYISDLGLRNAHMNFRQVEVTHILENIVFLELKRRGYTVDIGKNREKEIDFIAKDLRDTYYIQVAYSMIDQEKSKQELSSFYRLDDGYKKIVITMDDDPFNLLEKGYRKINAIDFLLDEDSLEKA